MVDAAFYWVGVVTAGAGIVGIIATLAMWSVNQLVDALNMTKALTQAYARYLRDKHAALKEEEGRG